MAKQHTKPEAESLVQRGELLRVKLPRTPGCELRVIVGVRSWLHVIPTNKEQITLVGGERKLRRA